MSNYSTQQTMNYAKLLGLVLTIFGYSVPDDKLIAFVGVLMILGSIVISFIDRFKKGDVTLLGRKK